MLRFILVLALLLSAPLCLADPPAPSVPKDFAELSAKTGLSVDALKRQAAGEDFASPEVCGSCHPRQYAEWKSSSHAYAAVSPTFNTFEMVVQRATNGAFADNGRQPNFCNKCHTPIGDALGEFSDYAGDVAVAPMQDGLSAVSRRGVSCETCHRVMSLDHTRVYEEGRLGDGVANASLILDVTSGIRRGPIDDPKPSFYHEVAAADHFKDASLCGGCHDVRIGYTEDAITHEPFLRLENLFTEFKQGPYANLAHPKRERMEKEHPLMVGRVGKCQDCHMSLYPVGEVAEYPRNLAAVQGSGPETLEERRVSTHYFTGVDRALLADFPDQDNAELDEYGIPRGLNERRKLLLQRAVRLTLDETPAGAVAGATFPLRVTVENIGAGHHVVSGFSQERQMWIEATVTDASGATVFSTGYLRRFDAESGEFVADPNGNGDGDEDWAYHGIHFATGTLEPEVYPEMEVPGPDRHLRTFTNHFEYVDSAGKHHETHLPLGFTNHMNNFRTLRPFEPATTEYNIPLPADVTGPLEVKVRIRFRHFPPFFLRYLLGQPESLVTADMLDRLEIIDMAEAQMEVALHSPSDMNKDGQVDCMDLMMFQQDWGQGR